MAGTVFYGEVAALRSELGALAEQMSTTDIGVARARLTADDLVPDEPLRGAGKNPIADSQDLLHHRVIARKVAELATSANGKVNIALFGPWGAGKSSFNELLREELKVSDPKARHITFDAWKNAGDGFRANFLSELARQIPKADNKISDQLFQATTKVSFPFANLLRGDNSGKGLLLIGGLIMLVLFILLPLAWTCLRNLAEPVDNFFDQWLANIGAWSGFAGSSTVLALVLITLVELSKVTVSKSAPSHVAQFSVLFNKLLNTGAKHRYVIFIDELDRCGKKDVMATLEGLRTFLGHDRCVFVVAFDRDAIATTIAEEMQHSVPSQSVSPYYRTSGEYLDKIFQFQLALPPQPAHTFRRYALSLVRERGGVWRQLREGQDGLLDRVVAVLSPMHLASPRRTKVLLNDFAVNARVFESLGFDWLERAEEIAVLTVIQTEFPNLMADIERAPSLMRFLYREETPTRPEILTLLDRYRTHDRATTDPDVELDRVVKQAGAESVARDLQINLGRYLRRLREMGAPEPRVDLVMMHSDGDLLHFEDPDVYNQVLLAADLPRKDIVSALQLASTGDRALAIDHILEQAEPESAQIALNLRVLAGEIAGELPTMSLATATNLRAAMFAGLAGHTQISMEGYARAVAVSFTDDASTQLLDAAAKHSEEALGAVIDRFVEDFKPTDWETVKQAVLTRVLENAAQLPDATAAVLRRVAENEDTQLDAAQIAILSDSLSASEPEEVQPAAATVAARNEAEEQNSQLQAAFTEERDGVRTATEIIIEIWSQLPVDGGMRGSLLSALRKAGDGSDWHMEKHDRIILDEIGAGNIKATNAHLLTAITAQPALAALRWRKHLSDDAPVDAQQKANALNAVVNRATNSKDVHVRTNGADNALRIARLPSGPVAGAGILMKVSDAIARDWDEYTDDRFEYLSTLLRAVDALCDPEAPTTAHRVRLYLDAVTSAQAEEASVAQIVTSLNPLAPAEVSAVVDGLMDERLWEEDYPEHSTRVLLAAQEVALCAGVPVAALPASAVAQLTDPATKKQIADAWLQTAPPTAEVKSLLPATTFSATAWQRFGERVPEDQRAEMWDLLIARNAPLTALRALSAPGQPLRIYEDAAAMVRDGATKSVREVAVDRLLVLPAAPDAAGIVQALVKTIARERKITEFPFGWRLIRVYHPHWSKSTISSIKPVLTPWAEVGGSYIAQRDLSWLAQEGYIARKSSVWENFFGKRK